MSRTITRLEDLTPDPRNANRGTERGAYQLEESLRRYGAGRSVLADRNGVLIAGNKTAEKAVELGLRHRVVETDGTELVIVQRTDLDLDSEDGRMLAYADNAVGAHNLDWDPEVVQVDVDAGLDLSPLFLPEELRVILPDLDLAGDQAAEGAAPSDTKRVVLFLDAEEYAVFMRAVDALKARYETDDTTRAVYLALTR